MENTQYDPKNMTLAKVDEILYENYRNSHNEFVGIFYQSIVGLENALNIFEQNGNGYPTAPAKITYNLPKPIENSPAPEIFKTFQPCTFNLNPSNVVSSIDDVPFVFAEQEKKLKEEKEKFQTDLAEFQQRKACLKDIISQKSAEIEANFYKAILNDQKEIKENQARLIEQKTEIERERNKLYQEKLQIQNNMRNHAQLVNDIKDLTAQRNDMEKDVTQNFTKLQSIVTKLETSKKEYEDIMKKKNEYETSLEELQKKIIEQEHKLAISKATEEKIAKSINDRIEAERKQELLNLKNEIAKRDSIITEKDKTIADLYNVINELQQKLKMADAKVGMIDDVNKLQENLQKVNQNGKIDETKLETSSVVPVVSTSVINRSCENENENENTLTRPVEVVTKNQLESNHPYNSNNEDDDELTVGDMQCNNVKPQSIDDLIKSINPFSEYEKNFEVVNIDIPVDITSNDEPCTEIADWAADPDLLQKMVDYTSKVNPELIFPSETVNNVDIKSVLNMDIVEKARRTTNVWPSNYEKVKENDKKIYYQHFDNNYVLNASLIKANKQATQIYASQSSVMGASCSKIN